MVTKPAISNQMGASRRRLFRRDTGSDNRRTTIGSSLLELKEAGSKIPVFSISSGGGRYGGGETNAWPSGNLSKFPASNKAFRRSTAVWYRSSGSTATAFSMVAANLRFALGISARTGGG